MVTDGIFVLLQHECKSLQKMLRKETNWSSVMTPQYTNVIQATQRVHQQTICILLRDLFFFIIKDLFLSQTNKYRGLNIQQHLLFTLEKSSQHLSHLQLFRFRHIWRYPLIQDLLLIQHCHDSQTCKTVLQVFLITFLGCTDASVTTLKQNISLRSQQSFLWLYEIIYFIQENKMLFQA